MFVGEGDYWVAIKYMMTIFFYYNIRFYLHFHLVHLFKIVIFVGRIGLIHSRQFGMQLNEQKSDFVIECQTFRLIYVLCHRVS